MKTLAWDPVWVMLTHSIFHTMFFHISGTEQMFSHGTADIILEACTDFWDGTDIYPLSGSDRWAALLFGAFRNCCKIAEGTWPLY